jgi:ribonuclease HI
LLAGSNIFHGGLNIIEGEVMAIKEAITELLQRGFSHVIIESDSQVVIEAISHGHQGASKFSSIISSIKSLLLLVPNFEVKFFRRQANMVAHFLARAAIKPNHAVFSI